MPTEHTIMPGECLASLAHRYGFSSWRAIYQDSANTDLRSQRPNPHQLCPGDRIVIPDRYRDKSIEVATGATHVFRVTRPTITLQLRLTAPDGSVCRGRSYRLIIDDTTSDGKTDSDGILEQHISPYCESAELILWHMEPPEGPGQKLSLRVGHLQPHNDIGGAQARLNNLGMNCRRVDGVLDDTTRTMIKIFQRRHGMLESGELDSITQEKLRALHDQK